MAKVNPPQFNTKPTTGRNPTSMGKKFEKKFSQTMNNYNVNLNEVDNQLNEKEQSLKKQIWDLAKMESLVHNDPKLSSIYNEMAEDGEEKYGYHYNETIQNIIFNEYVLNDAGYLEKYKNAVPVKKKRRDKSGINQIKSDDAKADKANDNKKEKKEEGYNHNNSLEGVMEDVIDNNGIRRDGEGDFDDRSYLDHRIDKKYDTINNDDDNVEETTSMGGGAIATPTPKLGADPKKFVDESKNSTQQAAIAISKKEDQNEEELDETTTSASSGSYETPAAWAGKGKKSRHNKKPAYKGGVIIGENYFTNIDAFKKLFESLSEDDDPCWDGYKQVGMKTKDDKEVPNCVPEGVREATHTDSIVPMAEHHLESREDRIKFIADKRNHDPDIYDEFTDQEIEYIYKKLENEILGKGSNIKEGEIDEKATSKSQQRAAGIALAAKRKEIDPDELQGAAMQMYKTMDVEDLEKFASTKHKGLPNKVDEADDRIVQYEKEIGGEEPFEINGSKWQYVMARYPDGKRDIGVYKFGHDLVYSYDWFRKNVLNESIISQQPDTMAMSSNNPTSMANTMKGGGMGMSEAAKIEDNNKLKDFGTSNSGLGGFNGKGENPLDKANLKNPEKVGGKTMENITEDGYCRADEEPVPGKSQGQEGACRKKKGYKKRDDAATDARRFNLEKRKEREKEYKKKLQKSKKMDAKKKHKEEVNEDRKPSSLVMLDRLKKDNEEFFKSDMKDSNTSDIMDNENRADDEYTQIDDPQKMTQDIEKEKLSQNKGESFENVGNSTNQNNKEIPKRNHTAPEQDDVSLTRKGMHTIKYDNKPDERFEERMKKDMGDEFYQLRQDKMKHDATAPMYNKDNEFVQDADKIKKTRYNKNVSGYNDDEDGVLTNESMITGRYTDIYGKKKIIDFKLHEATEVESVDGLSKINLDGMGNSYTSKIDENTSMRDIMNSFEFYFDNDNNKVVKHQSRQRLSENEVKTRKPVNEQFSRMMGLIDYNPAKKIDTKNVKRYRGF